jgi:Xaa-Pro dipeptidase
MLTPILSRQRQKRLLDVMQQRKMNAVVIGDPRMVYYFTSHWTDWRHASAFVLFDDGRSVLYTANAPNKAAAADDVREYPANVFSSLDPRATYELGGQVGLLLRDRNIKELGIDVSTVTCAVSLHFSNPIETLEDELSQMRRVKDADELELMKKAIACCGAMYERAREIIEPGVPEVKVFAALQAAAVEAAGEPLAGMLGNDYACGCPGGPPRDGRPARDGELYILDLGPVYRGYFSDNARTFAVNRNPTDAQMEAWHAVLGCLGLVEANAKAGTPCYHLVHWVNDYLKEKGRPELGHHLGHGVGLAPHEHPFVNPEWDDTLQEGEVFTAEPGIYGEELGGGIRIENQYLVTKEGVVRLSDFPVTLG